MTTMMCEFVIDGARALSALTNSAEADAEYQELITQLTTAELATVCFQYTSVGQLNIDRLEIAVTVVGIPMKFTVSLNAKCDGEATVSVVPSAKTPTPWMRDQIMSTVRRDPRNLMLSLANSVKSMYVHITKPDGTLVAVRDIEDMKYKSTSSYIATRSKIMNRIETNISGIHGVNFA